MSLSLFDIVDTKQLGSFVSRSMQCSGDALANRLKLLLKSQKNGFEKRGELATLLTEITGDTSDSVIEAMTNSVLEVKDDTELQVAFLDGMHDNLVDDKLTTSGKNAVLNAFTHHCENLNRVRVIDHAFARLQDAQPSQAQAFLRQAEAFLRQKRMPVRKRSESMTK